MASSKPYFFIKQDNLYIVFGVPMHYDIPTTRCKLEIKHSDNFIFKRSCPTFGGIAHIYCFNAFTYFLYDRDEEIFSGSVLWCLAM